MIADLPFPAVVTSPDGDHWPMARLRVLVDPLTVEVFAYERGAVRLVGRAIVLDYTRPAGRGPTVAQTWTLTTAAGDWLVQKGQGCGCGHPLKRATATMLDQAARQGIYTDAA